MQEVKVDSPRPNRLGLLHCAITGGVVFGIIFVACWLGAAVVPIPVTHMFIEMFTPAAISSTTALLQGLCWSLVFGAWAGFVLAIVNNLVVRLTMPG